MATSDSFLVFIRSSLDLNFAVLVSKDDDISSLKNEGKGREGERTWRGTGTVFTLRIGRERSEPKVTSIVPSTHLCSPLFTASVLCSGAGDIVLSSPPLLHSPLEKAEEQFLDLYPQKGTIVAQAIKVMREETMYYIPGSIPVKVLLDKDETKIVFMDAVVVSPNRVGSSQDDLHMSNKEGANNSQIITLDAAAVGMMIREEEENPIVGEEHVSKRQSQDVIPEENGFCNEKERRMAFEKEERKVVEDNCSAENAGETSSLAPKVTSPEDVFMNTPLTKLKGEDRVRERHRSKKSGEIKIKKSQDKSNLTIGSRVASGEKKRRARESVGDGSVVFNGKKQKVMISEVVPDELRCKKDSGSGWRCRNEALPDMKFCYRHSSKK